MTESVNPSASGLIDTEALEALRQRIGDDIDAGMVPAAQFALAVDGEVIAEEAFGEATADTRFCIFSATKPIVAAAIWRLIAAGDLDPAKTVATWFPEFAQTGKEAVTLEQVMLHTAGFPLAPMGPKTWHDRDARRERMATWRLSSEPGSRYVYHASAAHWVLAELLEIITGKDYRDAVHDLVTGPLGLPRIVGIPSEDQDDIAPVTLVGEVATEDELEATFGVRSLPATEVTDEAVTRFNEADTRAVGVPGGGGFARAVDLARFYQALLHNHGELWPQDLLHDVTSVVRNQLPDPTGVPASRTLGLLVAGEDGKANVRGFGRTVSPRAFGHNGAGGQIAWADPSTGLSFAFVNNGYDRHQIRGPRRTTSIASRAGVCLSAG